MLLNRLAEHFLALPRSVKRLLVLSLDATLCVFTLWAALCLRFESLVALQGSYLVLTLVSLGLSLPVFALFGLYQTIFRYTGINAMMNVGKGVGLYGLVFALIYSVTGVPGIPRSIGVLQPLLFLVCVVLSRILARYWLGDRIQALSAVGQPSNVLIYGAGAAGRQLAAGLRTSAEIKVVGLLDDDERLHGHVLNGLKIYNPADLAQVVERKKVNQVLLAIPSATRARRNAILHSMRNVRVLVRTLPGLMDLAHGRIQVSDLRDLDIDDLLGRESMQADAQLLKKNIQGKVVLVTGAGGSIGSELCRQIVMLKPVTLLLVDLSEFALYSIFDELKEHPEVTGEDAIVTLVPLLASVRDAAQISEILCTWQPNTVYHAAAYKHVPLVEHNIGVGVKNNVLGTWIMAQQSMAHGVSDFVLVSTDKAVRPTNIMGASKRLAELVLQAYAASSQEQARRTCFSMVRFGNVLGSSGSVVPKFRQQIRDGGPITLTHTDITRYFMTIPEAAKLVIQAGTMAKGGDVFVLDMGDPVKIIDLARRMVEMSGLCVKDEMNPYGDIAIEVTGLRPGEKLYEELLVGGNPLPTSHPLIMKAHEAFMPWPELQKGLDQLNTALDLNDVLLVRDLIKKLVPAYQPEGEVVDWIFQAQQVAAARLKQAS